MDSSAPKRLVIFGCGYVGAAVAVQAVSAGMRVTALTRNAAKARLLREQGIAVVEADLAGDAWHAHLAGAADYAVNCVSSGGGGIEGYRHSYLKGMSSIVRWAEGSGGVGTLVYTSSTSVYPESGGGVVDESSPVGGPNERAQVLLAAEMELRRADKACARWFVLRLAGIYGPGRHHLLEQVRAGEVAGVGDHPLNVIHRDDIAAAIASCLAAPASVRNEIFNVADNAPARKRDVAAWLAERLEIAPPRFTGEPAAGRNAVTPDRVISNRKIRTALGWEPRYPTYREGYAALLSC